MCCRFNCCCNCGAGSCGASSGGSWGCGAWNGGAATLPSFPDRPVFEPDTSSANFPVYVSLPASAVRGSANLRAAVNLDSGCPCSRG